MITDQQENLVILIMSSPQSANGCWRWSTGVYSRRGELHPTYVQSARNLFHYLALRRYGDATSPGAAVSTWAVFTGAKQNLMF